MQYSVINRSKLERTTRLDSEFYQSVFLSLLESIARVKTLPITDLCKVSDGNHMSVAEYFQDEGVPYYRGQNVNTDFFLEDAQPVHIPKEIYERSYMKRSYFHAGDVLLSIVGTVGSLSLITDEIKESTGSCKLAILRPSKISPEYLSAFLMSKYGNLQIKRNTRGAVQTGLLLEDMNQINVFVPDKAFESKITTLVHSAILGNRQAKSIYSQAEEVLLAELGLTEWKPRQELAFVKRYSEVQKADRFDADCFQPKYEEIVSAIKRYKGGSDDLGNLVKVKKSVEPGSEAYQESGIPFVRVSNLSKFELSDNNQQFISDELYADLKTHQPKQGEILLSKDATLGVAYYLREKPEKMIVSGGILRLQVNGEKMLPEYLTLALNSMVVQKQIERDAGGSIIAHWRPDQVKTTLIPLLRAERQQEIKKLVDESFDSRIRSKSLLDIAKRGVELAIEKDEKAAEKWIDEQTEKVNSMRV